MARGNSTPIERVSDDFGRHGIGTFHQLCPRFILERYQEGEYSGSFDCAGVDIDISGFTRVTDALSAHGREGAELLARIIHAVFEPLTASVHEYDGFIANYTGDGFLALFPSPTQDAGQGPLHALASSWQMRQALRSRHRYHTSFGDFQFNARIGVAHGRVHWRILSARDGRRHVYYFSGAPVVESARVRPLVSPGELSISPIMLDRLSGKVTATRVGGGEAMVVQDTRDLPPPLQESQESLPDAKAMAAEFYPSAVLESESSGEFRQCVNLLINLDDPCRDLDGFVECLFSNQDRYGGYLNCILDGDKGCTAILFWGAPVATENDIERALEFAHDLVAENGMRIRAGMTLGLAHAGYAGSVEHETYTCTSSAINLAARLMTQAQWNTVYLDKSARGHALERFHVSLIGETRLKGFTDDQHVYVLGDRKRDIVDVVPGRLLVDRESELQLLVEGINKIYVTDQPGVYAIVGEAGSGKSSLLAAVTERLAIGDFGHVAGLKIVDLSADNVFSQPFGPFKRALEAWLQLDDSDSAGRRRLLFDNKVDRLLRECNDATLASELELTRSFLASIVDIHWPGSTYASVGPALRLRNVIRSLAAWLRCLAAGAGRLLVTAEDIHAYDTESLDVLRSVSRIDGSGIAMMASSRLGDGGELPELPFAGDAIRQTVELGGLSRDGISQIAEHALDCPVSPRTIDFLERKTNGIPFYLEQLLLTLGVHGTFIQRGTGEQSWIEISEDSEDRIPEGINGIIVSRLDRLSPRLKSVVQTASVLGQEFDTTLLGRIVRDERLEEIVQAVAGQHIVESIGHGRYRFRHALLRDVAYDMQLGSVRRDLHRQAAEVLEELDHLTDTDRYAGLAFHYERAELTEKARRYLDLAAKAARESYQTQAATGFYRRLLRYELPQESEVAVCQQLGEIMNLTGDWAEAMEHLERGLSSMIGPTDPHREIEILITLGDVLRKSEHHGSARERLELAYAKAQRTGETQLGARALAVLAGSYKYAGQYKRAMELYRQTLKMAEAAGDEQLCAVGFAGIGSACGLLGRCHEGIEYNQRAIAVLEILGDKQELVYPLVNAGIDMLTTGMYEDALPVLERALSESTAIGDREGIWLAYHFIGRTRNDLGDYSGAMSCYQNARRERRALGGDSIPFHTQPHMADTLFNLKDYQSALETALSYLELLHGDKEDREHGYAYLVAAKILAFLEISGDGALSPGMHDMLAKLQQIGVGEDCRSWFRRAEKIARHGGHLGLTAWIRTLAEYAMYEFRIRNDHVFPIGCLAAAWRLAHDNRLDGESSMVESYGMEMGVDAESLRRINPIMDPFAVA